ncbi:hypothetical protein ACVIW2_009040 [Bradyrhizobium huanghuaihaiense]|uniref:Uncharacterized protein n=1 Tax=Bradyrhizobium huanghuaihaiense TaxID=990078 RepID=A0A562RXQ5_9BRAD|nr:hypothetical protein [Bradyrhizobium huanghuaihaiense]TWI73768.1 hypothetical protein IQ16_01911 [Bradyrhizobium huanghuaihaiense]
MAAFFTDEQIQEAIAALEKYSPGIWETMKKMALVTDPSTDEHATEQAAIVRALTVVLPKVTFVVQAQNPFEAQNLLLIDVRKTIWAEVDAAKGSS